MYLVARGWENFKFLGDLLYWEGPNFLFGRGGYAIFFYKAINDQSCKLKNSWWQSYLLHVYMLTFYSFNWEFSPWEFYFCSCFHWKFQKSVYYCVAITLWKCEYCFIWALNKSILFGRNSLKVSVLYHINSEKTFYYSLIWKELFKNVSIVWCKLR